MTVATPPSRSTPALPASKYGSLPVAREVALAESRRLLAHPLFLIGCGLFAAMIVVSSGTGPGGGYDGLVTGPTFFIGVFTFFAANLVASRPRRHDCDEQHASLPAPPVAHTAGLCLASLAPALGTVALMAVIMAWYASGRVNLTVWPSPAELAAGPLTVLGGALLGVMTARWLRFPTAPALVMIAMVAVNFTLSEATDRYELLGPYATNTVYVPDGSWGGRRSGSFDWHAVYLLALCGMAAAGAMLRDARRWILPLSVGGLCTAAAVFAGVAQLP